MYDAYVIANDIDTVRNFPNEDADAVVAEVERRRAAKRQGKPSSSRFRGVSWSTSKKKWVAKIYVAGKTQHLGSFSDEDKAGRTIDTYVVDNNLDRPLNFPVAAEEKDGASSSSVFSDDAVEDHGAAAAAAAAAAAPPAAKRRKTSSRAPSCSPTALSKEALP